MHLIFEEEFYKSFCIACNCDYKNVEKEYNNKIYIIYIYISVLYAIIV